MPDTDAAIGPVTVHAIIKYLALLDGRAVKNILAVTDEIAGGGILGRFGMEDQIAVLEVPGIVAVGTGFLRHPQKGHFMPQLVQLFEERPLEIVFPAVIPSVPVVRPPAFRAIDLVRRFRRIYGYVKIPAKIACPFIEIDRVPEEEPPLEPAIGTEGRRRHIDMLIEPKVLRFDGERLLAVLAGRRGWACRMCFGFVRHSFQTTACR